MHLRRRLLLTPRHKLRLSLRSLLLLSLCCMLRLHLRSLLLLRLRCMHSMLLPGLRRRCCWRGSLRHSLPRQEDGLCGIRLDEICKPATHASEMERLLERC